MRGRGVDTKMGDEGSEVGGMDSLFEKRQRRSGEFLKMGGDLKFENQIPGVCRMRNRRVRGNMPMRDRTFGDGWSSEDQSRIFSPHRSQRPKRSRGRRVLWARQKRRLTTRCLDGQRTRTQAASALAFAEHRLSAVPEGEVIAFTDGASRGNPGPWGESAQA